MRSPASLFDPPFVVRSPERQTVPVVFNSPHSGSTYPEDFLRVSRLEASMLRRSEDCYVDELFSAAVGCGAPLIQANFPRAYVDVNREPFELDPHLIEGPLPRHANTSSARVAGGLGTIPRIVCEGEDIYYRKISLNEALARIAELYQPYHAALNDLLHRTRHSFGAAVLIDCHSMPSSAAANSTSAASNPDIVLGDRHGNSCAEGVVHMLEQKLRAAGLRVLRNRPYAGGFITETYGRPAEGFHAVQIEINRAAYLDERTLARQMRFDDLKRKLAAVLKAFLPEVQNLVIPRRIAAE
jgi:N-formylglutamate amidohydrolase